MAAKKNVTKAAPNSAPTPGLDELEHHSMPTVDADLALAAARSVLERIEHAGTRARFERLPEAELDHAIVDDYAQRLEAAEKASNAYAAASAGETDAMVPYALIQRGHEIRSRMLSCAEHNLKGNAKAEARLADIREGRGHRDLVADLRALASVYDDHRAVLARDGNHYRSGDPADARTTAREVEQALESKRRASSRRAGRAWAQAFNALREAHDEIIAAGRWLDHKQPDAEERWPSLFSRASTGKRKGAKKKGAQKVEGDTQEKGTS